MLAAFESAFVLTASAQGSCGTTQCGGGYYIDRNLACGASMTCQGVYADAVVNFTLGSPSIGWRQNGTTGCTPAGCVPSACNRVTCPVMGGCSSNNDCPSGQRCSGGSCQDYTCPNSNKCRDYTDCVTTTGYSCLSNGCCELQSCSDDYNCPMGFRCSGYQCVQYHCTVFPNMACRGESCNTGYHCDGQPSGCCQSDTPILLDIEGDGFLLTSAERGVRFDIDGKGKRELLSWTAAGTDDGWLALDRNNNGTIDDGKELFGNYTQQPESTEPNGFLALAVFDKPSSGGTSDSWITEKDSIFNSLLIWQDRNHNGFSEPGELTTLRALGITAISVDYKESKWVDIHGNQFRYRARIQREGRGRGSEKWAYDIFLVRAQ